MKTFLVLLFSTSLAWSAQVGDTRTTEDGFEKCIAGGQYETWALIIPSDKYKTKMKSEREANEYAKEAMKFEIKEKQDALDEIIAEHIQAKKAKK